MKKAVKILGGIFSSDSDSSLGINSKQESIKSQKEDDRPLSDDNKS